MIRGAIIAQWIRLCLPSCHPGFEYKAHHPRFHQFIELCNVEKTKISKKEAGIGPIRIIDFSPDALVVVLGVQVCHHVALERDLDALHVERDEPLLCDARARFYSWYSLW